MTEKTSNVILSITKIPNTNLIKERTRSTHVIHTKISKNNHDQQQQQQTKIKKKRKGKRLKKTVYRLKIDDDDNDDDGVVHNSKSSVNMYNNNNNNKRKLKQQTTKLLKKMKKMEQECDVEYSLVLKTKDDTIIEASENFNHVLDLFIKEFENPKNNFYNKK